MPEPRTREEKLFEDVKTLLAALQGSSEALAGQTDTLEALVTTLNGHVDGLEALVGTSNTNLGTLAGHVDGLEALITTLNGYTDGLEGLLTSLNAVPSNASSSAAEASRVVKNAAGTLYGMTGFNTKASQQYIQLHDAAAVPADTAVPKIVIPVPANSPFQLDWNGRGRAFANGIVVCNSSTIATKTIGAADCWFDAQYS